MSITHVGEQAREAQVLATEAGRLAVSGTAVISETINDINEIAQVVDGSSSLVDELQTQSGLISSVVQTIREIADLYARLRYGRAPETSDLTRLKEKISAFNP